MLYNKPIVIFFLALLATQSSCQNSQTNPSKSENNDERQINSPMQRDFDFGSNFTSPVEFREIILRAPISAAEIYSPFPPLVFGRSAKPKDFDKSIFRYISPERLINIQEENSENGFDHEILLVNEQVLKGIIIKLFIPRDLIPIFRCSFTPTSTNDTNKNKLDKIFQCLEEIKDFGDSYHKVFIGLVEKMQKHALSDFLRINWLGGKGYNNPYLISSENASGAYNSYTSNLNLGWIKDGLVTIITLCTPKFGSFHALDEDYFSQIEEYQSEKKKYPILRCLITTVDAAKKNNFIDINQFLSYKSALSGNNLNDF